MKHWKQLDEKRFKQIKDLQAIEGMKRKMVCMISHYSYATVMNCEKVNTFDDYKRMFRKQREVNTTTKSETTRILKSAQLDRIEEMVRMLLADRKEKGWLEKLM